MAETDVLNDTFDSLLNPEYGWQETPPGQELTFAPQAGGLYSRHVASNGRAFQLTWDTTPRWVADRLMQWERQYRFGYFTLRDWESGRCFTGRFMGRPARQLMGNDQWTVTAVFQELSQLPLLVNLGDEEQDWDSFGAVLPPRQSGADLVLATGAWVYNAAYGFAIGDPPAPGGAYYSSTTNDTIEWLYFGYGFRLYSPKDSNQGKLEISHKPQATGVWAVLATIDLYAAATVASDVVFTAANLNLDLHRIKLRVTGTKNVASTGFLCYGDAIEVLE